jgi:hypothetical protein
MQDLGGRVTSVKVTIQVEDSDRHKVGSTVVDVPLRSKTLFGCAVTPYPGSGRNWAQEVAAHFADCGVPRIVRSYDGGQPATWDNKSSAQGSEIPYNWGNGTGSWHSIKPDVVKLASGQLDKWAEEYVESIPVTGVPRLLTVWHEPESKIKSGLFTARDWKRAVHRFGRIVRQVNHPDVRYGPIFMSKFTLGTASYHVPAILASDSTDLWEICDFVGWDPYNESTKGDEPPNLNPSYYLDDLVKFTKSTGLPMAVGETGFIPDPRFSNERPEWLTRFADYAEANSFLAACYFDASVGNHWWLRIFPDGTRDQASIDAWSEVYRR